MANYLRNERHRNPEIRTRDYSRSSKRIRLSGDNATKTTINQDEVDSLICFMKNKFVNSEKDKEEIFDAMQKTSDYRISWIKNNSPSLTEILFKFSKFLDYPFMVYFLISFF